MGKLDRLQSEIDQTRERLASNLKVLTRDETIDELQETFIGEATAKKNQVVEIAKASGQDLFNELIASVKTKVAENPAAALAIGAGIGWKLWKNPPVASVLVGVGLYSLFTGKTETSAISDKVTETLSQAGERITEGLEAGKTSFNRTSERTQELAAEAWASTRNSVEKHLDNLAEQRLNTKNAALLGVAGIAVAAAVGLAVQKFRDDS
jgi:hypothetical protein